jgi:hypothetical protein
VRCNASDSCAGQASCSGGALLVGAECFTGSIVASQEAALVADSKGAVGELMDGYRAAYEMDPLAGGGQLENEVLNVTVLSLHTIRSCLLDNTSSNSIPASLTKALSGWDGLTVKLD